MRRWSNIIVKYVNINTGSIHTFYRSCLLSAASSLYWIFQIDDQSRSVTCTWWSEASQSPVSHLIMSDVKFSKAGEDESKVTFISGNHKTISTEEKGISL